MTLIGHLANVVRGDISLGNLMLRMFTQFHKFMEAEYLPVVFPLENQKEISTHFGKRTRLALSRSLNVAQTSHSYGDIMLLTKASESEQLFHVKSLEAIDFLDKFLSMSPDSSGHVTLNGFLSALRLKDSNLGNEIFQFIDTENNGSHVMKQPLFKADCEQAFHDCDSGGNDHVSAEQFGECIRPAIPEMMKDEIKELFGLFDVAGNGKPDKEESLSCLKQNPLLIALLSSHLGHARTPEATADDIV
ncbi:hypothetical protein SAY87_014575 [Trapa incisa]|uniref:EF-hand domain-containing protein n=1 Tax=Trapa incisa TaxID=236973 RepID=A0AAN7H031_9MYRT|nr:hypothetical protein SAY87_014575 [Trapa incisa]